MKETIALAAPFDNLPRLGQRLDEEFNVVKIPLDDQPPPDLDPAIVTGLVTTSHEGVPAWLWDAPNLRVIGNFGVGYDGIDTVRAAQKGVWVTNTPGVLSDAVADLAMALMLALVRELPATMAYAKQGKWLSGDHHLTDNFHGRKLGLLGMGNIGKEIALRANAFKMDISYHCRTPKDVPWKHMADLLELAQEVDILCCIVPGGEETYHLVNAKVLETLGPEGYLINVGRGSAVDEQALIEALAKKKIAGAAIDVYENEPKIPPELLAQENAICLPHMGSGTVATRMAMGELVIENMLAVYAGKRPPTPVNEPA